MREKACTTNISSKVLLRWGKDGPEGTKLSITDTFGDKMLVKYFWGKKRYCSSLNIQT